MGFLLYKILLMRLLPSVVQLMRVLPISFSLHKSLPNSFSVHAMHDGEVEKSAKSGQLWNVISPQIFIPGEWNFDWSCLNSQRIEKRRRKNDIAREKSKKTKCKKTCCWCFFKVKLCNVSLRNFPTFSDFCLRHKVYEGCPW